MKKITITLMLLVALSTFVFADDGGVTPGGGKTCPGQPTCRVEVEDTFIKYIKDFLTDLFG